MIQLRHVGLAFGIIALLSLVFAPLPSQGQDAPFITIWDTEKSGQSNNNQITIPGGGTDYLIEWEELGNLENNGSELGTDEHTVTFPNPGAYRVKISGDFTRINFGLYGSNNTGDKNKIVLITQWGDIQWSTMRGAFFDTEKLDIGASNTRLHKHKRHTGNTG